MKQTAKEFMASISVDKALYNEEIIASMAHARMLQLNDLITEEECEQMVDALGKILDDIEQGKVKFKVEYDDIHGCIEALLEEKIGPVAFKLNQARSVNDQVVVDTRMFLKKETNSIKASLDELLNTLEQLAKKHVNTIMPGY